MNARRPSLTRVTLFHLDSIVQDLKYGLRQLRLKPGFTLAAVLSLALGIGANTAIFTLTDQIILRLLPVENPRALVQLRVNGGRFGSQSGDGIHTFPYPTYIALRDNNTVFTGISGQRIEGASLIAGDRNEIISLGLVAGNYFGVLGVRPHLGRTITPDDDRQLNGHPVVVLQYDFWRTRFDARSDLIGQSIRLNGLPFTVIGVAAREFAGTETGLPTKAWVPVAMRPTITPSDPRLDEERSSWFYLFARLKPGVTLDQAQASMRVVYRQRQNEELNNDLFTRFPTLKERFLRQTFLLEPAEKGGSGLRGFLERPLIVLQWLVGAVLLIACSNVAGLLLARGAARQREIAIRCAIGAGRGRVIRQLLSESLLLAAGGGATGLLIGWGLTRFLISMFPVDPTSISLSATPDARILLFTLAVTALTTLVFGLLPAWKMSGVEPAATMREESGSIAGGNVRLRKVFVALQVGLSVMLLLGAGLFVRTLRNLKAVDLGVQTENVAAFAVRPAAPVEEGRRAHLYRSLIEGLARTPGVRGVGANTTRLFTGGRSDGSITVPGIPEKSEPSSFFNFVSPGYFEALGIPVKAGRDFTWSDWGSGRRYALVNEQLAKEYFGDSVPVGRMVGRGMRAPLDIEIVGMFSNSRYHDVRGAVPRQMFMNLGSNMRFVSGVNVYARIVGDPARMMPVLRAAVARIDPNFVVSEMRTLDAQIGLRLANEFLVSSLSGGFAILATLLAMVGFHGVLAFVVARRTREIGIRMALGAGQASVVRMICGEMSLVIACGLAAGVAAGYFCGSYVESQLFGVKANDPLVFLISAGALLLAAAVATLLPAWRASRIDPVRALRYE